MKLIRILVLVAATAAVAAAQNTGSTGQSTGSGGQPSGTAGQKQKSSATAPSKTNSTVTSSHKGGSNAQTPPVKVVVSKTGAQTGAKNSSSTNSKVAVQSSGKTAVAHKPSVSGPPATKSGPTQKTPVVTVKPVQKPATNAKNPSVAAISKKKAKAVTAQKKNQVKVVPQKTAGKNTSPVSEARNITAAGRRDPFLSIVRSMPAGPAGPTCSVGKSCLYIPDLELKGIAKDTEGQMLAVVVSNTHRAYFLRENDQVFNGSVQRITNDSVVFREFATDHLGRETAHEVVKKIPKS
jgi:hypothetical protein